MIAYDITAIIPNSSNFGRWQSITALYQPKNENYS